MTSLTAPTITGESPAVVVFGSANADLVVAVARRPAAGETVIGADVVVSPGGKGANQAVAAARLGARVCFVGCAGDDDHGRLLRSSLREAGVDVGLLRATPAPTGSAVVLVTPDGENSIVVSPGANAQLGAPDVEAARGVLGAAAVLVLQREVDPVASAAAAAITGAGGGRVILSLAPSGPVPETLLRLADPVIVNRQEALDLIGNVAAPGSDAAPGPSSGSSSGSGSGSGSDSDSDSDEDLALVLAVLATGPRSAVVTLGVDGAVAANSAGVFRVAAPRVVAVDTTGAGDALAGALACRFAAGDDLLAALRIAVQVAAQSVTAAGAQPSYPTTW